MVKKVTGFDVARRAGVSQPTVSRVLRNLPGASPETRERVLTACRELAYVPSESGRILSTRRTRRIAVVAAEMVNPYYPELVEPIRRSLARHGYRIVVVTDEGSDDVAVGALADGAYDGVILTTTHRRSRLPRDLTEHGIPHVLANRTLDHPESPSCSVDNRGGAAQIADLLVNLGHEHIGSVQGLVETSTGRERAEALTRRLRRHGVTVHRELTRRVEFTHDAGLRAATALLDREDPPTAIVAGNDVVAFGVLSAARRLGVRVPEELTVIGFDDIPMASWPLIDLTTVRGDLDVLADLTVHQLLSQLAEGRITPEIRRVPATLVLRGTHHRV